MFCLSSCMFLLILKVTNGFINITSHVFLYEIDVEFLSNETVIEKMFVKTKFQCALMCVNNKECCSAEYNNVDRICSLSSCCYPETQSSIQRGVLKEPNLPGNSLIIYIFMYILHRWYTSEGIAPISTRQDDIHIIPESTSVSYP